jgi:hypothetical protein
MTDRIPIRERSAWNTDLAVHLLTAFDREDVLAECYCPDCDHHLVAEPRRRQRTLNITLIEETSLRCPHCAFSSDIIYRELSAHDGDRTVMIDGRVIRQDHVAAPSPA